MADTPEKNGDSTPTEHEKLKNTVADIVGTFDFGPTTSYIELPVVAHIDGANTKVEINYPPEGEQPKKRPEGENQLELGALVDWIGTAVKDSTNINQKSLPKGIAKFAVQIDKIYWLLSPSPQLYDIKIEFGEIKAKKFVSEWSPVDGVTIKNVSVHIYNSKVVVKPSPKS